MSRILRQSKPIGKQLMQKTRITASKSISKNLTSTQFKHPSPFVSQKREFSGPQEPLDTRKPEDVEPDFWDAWHWQKIVEDIEFEIQHYDPHYAILPLEEFEVL